jgi:hypothetical protein
MLSRYVTSLEKNIYANELGAKIVSKYFPRNRRASFHGIFIAVETRKR